MNWKSTILTVTAIATSYGIATGCNKKSDTSEDIRITRSYVGPGSDWSIDVAGTVFTLKESVNSIEVTGTIDSLSSGFSKMTVLTSNLAPGAPNISAVTYALNVPDFMHVMKPFSGNQMINMVTKGTCRSGGFSMNWIAVNDRGTALTGLFGTMNWADTTGNVTVDNQYNSDGTAVGGANVTFSSLACAEGTGTSGNYKMYFTQSGGAIVNTNTSNSNTADFIFAMEAQALSGASSLAGSWIGFVFDDGHTTKIQPVSATISSGTITLTAIDPETGSASGSVRDSSIPISNINYNPSGQAHNGMFTIDIDQNGTLDGGCIADVSIQDSTDKRIISCSAKYPSDSANYNLLLVYKP